MNNFERLMHYFVRYFTHSSTRFVVHSKLGLYKNLSDRKYLEKSYKAYMKIPLNLDDPKRYTEKLQWIKLYDRNPAYTEMVDKYAVKKYVAEKIGEEHIIKSIGVWDSADDIDFDKLPDKFVLKCTHDSGPVICKDKSKFNKKAAIKKLNKHLRTDFAEIGKEWPYKNVKRRVIAEEYMVDEKTSELRDYKFFCFNGEVKCFKIDFDRQTDHKANWYTPEGEFLDIATAVPNDASRKLEMPETLDKMLECAALLSEGIPFLRVDFYEANGQMYFGELTFFNGNGVSKFNDDKWDFLLGDWIELPPKREETV